MMEGCSANVGTWHSGRVWEWTARGPGYRDWGRMWLWEHRGSQWLSHTLLRPEAQGGEDDRCTWKDLALLGLLLYLTLWAGTRRRKEGDALVEKKLGPKWDFISQWPYPACSAPVGLEWSWHTWGSLRIGVQLCSLPEGLITYPWPLLPSSVLEESGAGQGWAPSCKRDNSPWRSHLDKGLAFFKLSLLLLLGFQGLHSRPFV